MRFRAISISLLFFSFLTAFASIEFTKKDVKQSLLELDESLAKREYFISMRQERINRLTDSLRTHSDDLTLLYKIAENYASFNNDSALHYLALGQAMAFDKDSIPFVLHRAELLPLSGAIAESSRIFESIVPDSLPTEFINMYYSSGRQMYSYMSSFPNVGAFEKNAFLHKALDCQKHLLDSYPKDSREYNFNLGEYYFFSGDKGKAKALLERVFDSEALSSNFRARAAHHLSAMSLDRGDENAYIYYLSQAAIADANSATREVAALQELGNYLYSKNDVARAYNYLTQALANAVECGAAMRMIESSKTLPIIERAKTAEINARQTTIYIILGILALILIAVIALVFFLRHKMRQMSQLQENLRKANKAKEVYISQFLTLCSIYMEKLNQFCKIANRKITAGKVDELLKLTKSGKFVEQQSSEFYEVFDNAFLHLYPDFPAQVNALLRPDDQIILKEGELLNTDLRILAFLRLGIEDSSKIAQVLNYSINTIYTYRNRSKARAINRDTFEEDIMKIASMD